MDKKQMEELMKARVVSPTDRQVVKSVDLLTPVAVNQEQRDISNEAEPTNNQTAEAANISAAKATNIHEPETGKKRGRPKSTTEKLVHYSTWLPEDLTYALRHKALDLHKKDYEVVTDAIRAYLDKPE